MADKKHTKKTSHGKKKRPLNEFFKKMTNAKKKGLKDFKYTDKNGKTKIYDRKEKVSKKSGAVLVYYKQRK